MPVQSVVFRRPLWTRAKAETWLKQHRFEGPPESQPDENETQLRYRQSQPDENETQLRYRQRQPHEGGRYITKKLPNYPGINLVIELSEAREPDEREGEGAGRRELVKEPDEAPEEGNEIFEVNRETSDHELDRWGRKNIEGFEGVVARSQYCDLYPEDEPMRPGSSCIVNLDYGYHKNGTHWCAARVSSEEPLVLYFDPFGQPPPRDISLRAKKDGRGMLFPDIQYQQLDEENCGPRSLAVLSHLAAEAAKGKELEAFAEIGQQDAPDAAAPAADGMSDSDD